MMRQLGSRVLPAIVAVAIGTATLAAAKVLAWGGPGHRIICEIAFLELEPAAKTAVQGILGAESLAQACVWPDTDGEVQQERREDHYVNVPRYWSSIWYEDCPKADRCLFTAIRSDETKLASAAPESQGQKKNALRFLGHWIGDLHQPMHVSFKDDRGGNDILLNSDIGCRKKLHDVWDNCIPKDLMEEAGEPNDTGGFAKKLRDEISVQDRQAWLSDMSLVAWANESFTIVRQAGVRYCTLDAAGKKCSYEPDNILFDPDLDEYRYVSLSGAYEDEHGATVRKRLKQAGVRLGAMLNNIFAP